MKIVQCDKRGQIVIPKAIRKSLNIIEDEGFWIFKTKEGIFLKKINKPSKKELDKTIKVIKNVK